VGPAVVFVGLEFARGVIAGVEFAFESGDVNLERGYSDTTSGELGVGLGEICSERGIGCCKVGDSGSIGSSGSGEVGNGFDGVLNIKGGGVVGRVVAGLVGSNLGVPELLVGGGKVGSKINPSVLIAELLQGTCGWQDR
jgi:hypothetical protein